MRLIPWPIDFTSYIVSNPSMPALDPPCPKSRYQISETHSHGYIMTSDPTIWPQLSIFPTHFLPLHLLLETIVVFCQMILQFSLCLSALNLIFFPSTWFQWSITEVSLTSTLSFSGYKVVAYCNFDCITLMTNDYWTSFYMLIGNSYILLGEMLI